MSPRRDPVPRAREAWHWLSGILVLGILGAGVVSAAVVLWENIEVGQLVPELAGEAPPLPLPEAGAAPAADGADFPVALFRSPRNAAYFPDTAFYAAELDRWRGWIEEAGGRIREVGSAGELAELDRDEVLALPEAPCLSSAERQAIFRHVAEGGAVVANWAVGARDEECGWWGWQTLLGLTRAEDVREIPTREALFLTVPAGTGLSAGVDPGSRVELRPDPSLALRVPGPKVYWSDWALNPAPDESGGGADAAMHLRRDQSGGRVAWFGVRAGQAVTARDSLLLGRVVQNGVRWAAGRFTAAPAPWPGARRSAVLFTMDVEDLSPNAEPVAELLRGAGAPGTFFVVSGAERDATLVPSLLEAGEVGSHTSDHTPLAGLPPEEQVIRLRRARGEVNDMTGGETQGLRPPEESFDQATLAAWRRLGGSYLVGVNEARSAAPEIHSTNAGPVVLLPRLVKDDYNIFVQDGALRAERLSQGFLEGARKIRALGGVVVYGLRTQIMNTPGRLEALEAVTDTLRIQGDWWMATGAEAARWWRARHRLEVGALAEGSAPAFRVTAPADEGIQDLWLDVVVPMATEGWTALVEGRAVDVDVGDWGLRVAIGDLEAGASKVVSLRGPEPAAAGS